MSASIIICCNGFVSIVSDIIGQCLNSNFTKVCFIKVSDDYLLISQFLMFLMVMLIQPYMLSIYGDLHSEKSEQVARLAYESEWYNCKHSDIKTIKFIIMRAQKPSYISIYRFAKVKKETFKEVSLIPKS